MHTTYRIDEAEHPLWLSGGTRLATSADASSVLADAGLDWSVKQVPMFVGGDPSFRQVLGHVANVRSDTGAVLGVVGSTYKPIDNAQLLDLAEGIVRAGAEWVEAGSTRGGVRVHALLRLPQDYAPSGLDSERVLPLLRVSNGHDGGLALTCSVQPVRLACKNGMLVPLRGFARSWKGRHSPNVERRLDEARKALLVGTQYYDALQARTAEMVERRMTPRAFERFVEQLVPLPVDVDVTAGGRRVANVRTVREAIKAAWTADDAANIRGTAYGALQAVTRYVTHDMRVRKTNGRSEADGAFERLTDSHPIVDEAYRILATA